MVKKSELKVLVGCDPEFFYEPYAGTFSYPVTVPGTKAAPFVVKDGAIQVDGLALELNIRPAENEEEFVTRCNSVFKEFGPYVRLNTIKIQATAEFRLQYLKSLDSSITELGCIPDLNAYTGEPNPRPNLGKNDSELTTRGAGGHIHVGWEPKDVNIEDPNHISNCFEVIKQLDYYVGVPSLFWDRDKKRRETYGKAGACRIKPYGVEYRTPSNQWFKDEKLQRFVYRQTVKAIHDLSKGIRAYDKYQGRAQTVIDSGVLPDLSWASSFCDDLPREYLDGSYLEKKAI